MGCNLCGGGSSWILILVLLLCCCGNDSSSTCSNGCNCGCMNERNGCGC